MELRKYDTFKEMYEDIPFEDVDYKGWSMEEMINGTYEIYLLNKKENGEH